MTLRSTPRHRLALLLVAALAAPGCAAPDAPAERALAGRAMIETRLFCGTSIPGGGAVREDEWEDFLARTVTPRFPAGLSVLDARGQWREASGKIAHEGTHVILILHEGGAATEAAIGAVAEEYKRRFRQEAVMRVDERAGVTF
jgi:hypothetical protein